MFRIVCTKHRLDLQVHTDAKDELGLIPCIEQEEESDTPDTSPAYMFELSHFYCPKGYIDRDEARKVQGDVEAYEKLQEEANCSYWHAVVDADTNYPLGDFLELDYVHQNWFRNNPTPVED